MELEPAQITCSARNMKIEVVSDIESFRRLEPVWDCLLEQSNADHPFVTFAWVWTWWECFGAGRSLYILVIKEGERIVGIAPLMLTRKRIYGARLRCLEFLANVHTPRLDLIIAFRRADAYRAIWNHLMEVRNKWDLLLLCQIPDGSPTLEHFSRFAKENQLPFAQWRCANSPYVLLGSDWQGYFNSLKAKYRANLRRRMTRLTDMGRVSLDILSGEHCDGALAEGLRLEGAVWKDQCGTSIQSRKEVQRFYTEIADVFSKRGWLRLNFLKLGDRRIAFQYAVCYKNKTFLLKPGYDPAYGPYSPSHLLCLLYLENASRAGQLEFDFLGAEDDWKLQWTRNVRAHYWMYIFSDSPLPSVLYFLKFHIIPELQRKRFYQNLVHFLTAFRRRLGLMEANL